MIFSLLSSCTLCWSVCGLIHPIWVCFVLSSLHFSELYRNHFLMRKPYCLHLKHIGSRVKVCRTLKFTYMLGNRGLVQLSVHLISGLQAEIGCLSLGLEGHP